MDDDLPQIYERGIRNAAVGIGYLENSQLRENLYNKLKNFF